MDGLTVAAMATTMPATMSTVAALALVARW